MKLIYKSRTLGEDKRKSDSSQSIYVLFSQKKRCPQKNKTKIRNTLPPYCLLSSRKGTYYLYLNFEEISKGIVHYFVQHLKGLRTNDRTVGIELFQQIHEEEEDKLSAFNLSTVPPQNYM